MSERNGICPSCYGSGRIVNVIDKEKDWKESGDCMMCGGTGFWGGAYPSPIASDLGLFIRELRRRPLKNKENI